MLLADWQFVFRCQDLPTDGAEVDNARRKYVLPGAIDVHTNLELPFGGTVASDDFYTGQKAADFGGTTTHIDFVIQDKGETLHQAPERGHKRFHPSRPVPDR